MENPLPQPNRLARLRGDWAYLSPEEAHRLRHLREKRCFVPAVWSSIEPRQGEYDEESLSLLREGLIRLLSLGVEPVLCLCAGEEPDWFNALGGWGQEDNLRCYLRFVGKVVRSVGHLVQWYITLSPANELARRGTKPQQTARIMSHMACAHIRAYRLIHDLRRDHGWEGTTVGFSLRMYPEGPLLRGLLSPAGIPLRSYQTLPMKAMGKGDFNLPLMNVLRVKPGAWCDFAAISVAGTDDGKNVLDCCALVDQELRVPVWLLDRY